MLEINHLTKYYGKNKGVEDININIEDGIIFGFIGPNGAGKSTTIKSIMKMINYEGEIYINNCLVDKKNDYLKRIVGYLPSEIHLYDDLKVIDMLKYSSSFYKKDCMTKALKLSSRLKLDLNRKIEELSLGNLKKVGIVLAFMHDPLLVILDEPTSGLDPLIQEEFYNILREEKKKGTTIFISSHNLNEVKKLCDNVGIIKEGNLLKIESMKDIIDQEYLNVTIISKDIKKIKKDVKGKVLEEKDNTLNIIYDKDINLLISKLSKYKVDKLLIEEPSLEDIFMHYYKEN